MDRADPGWSFFQNFLEFWLHWKLRSRPETQKNDPAVVFVGDKPKFLALPGLQGEKRAVQIIKEIAEDEEDTHLWQMNWDSPLWYPRFNINTDPDKFNQN